MRRPARDDVVPTSDSPPRIGSFAGRGTCEHGSGVRVTISNEVPVFPNSVANIPY